LFFCHATPTLLATQACPLELSLMQGTMGLVSFMQSDMNPTPASSPMFDPEMNGMNADQLLGHDMEHMYPAL
jgi:hypothetical protein